ncbi:hypothetical protein QAD02_019572 [Eretmocerus hayati]|uniref:Uncharacterized protein n=1 Tax=Eretmocerus hayati TaxID=131215 RepID=A0ACC2PK25_9HYME|nr:hypothetical protein QAD02_019572 [Eretmocerus hayati]
MLLSTAFLVILTLGVVQVSAAADDDAEEFEFDYISQVSLHMNGKHFGSGIVVHPRFVLTSWSILQWKSPKDITVVVELGEHKSISHGVSSINHTYNYDEISSPRLSPKGIVRPIRDLALILINGTFTDADESIVQPVLLPSQGYKPPVDASVTILGFDDIEDLEIDFLPVIDRAKCNKIYEKQGGLDEGDFCVKGDAKLCEDDRGTPLLINGTVAGIATWSLNCNSTDNPAIFTNVGDSVTWIESSIKYMLGEEVPWFDFPWEDHWFRRWFEKEVTGEVVCTTGPKRERIIQADCSAGCQDVFGMQGACKSDECRCLDWYLWRPIYDMLHKKP